MKLFFCPKCQDIIKLTFHVRLCNCGECYGYYVDDLNALVSPKAIPLGIANSSFLDAIRSRPDKGKGSEFNAFVIPKQCDTVQIIDNTGENPKAKPPK